MNKSLFIFLLLFFGFYTLKAQIISVDHDGNIGYFKDIENCDYKTLKTFKDINFSSVALSPDGKLYAGVPMNFLVEVDIKRNKIDTLGNFYKSRINSLHCTAEGYLVGARRDIEYYNLNTKEFTHSIGNLGSFNVGGGSVVIEDEIIFSVGNENFIKWSPENPNLPLLVFQHPFERLGFSSMTSIENKIIGGAVSFSSDSAIGVYEVNFETESISMLCKTELGLHGLTSETEFRTNYNMYLDLDVDNSGGRFINHYEVDTFCIRQIPLADRDVFLDKSRSYDLDSIVVQIENQELPTTEQIQIGEVPASIRVSQNAGKRIVLYPVGRPFTWDYEAAIRTLYYDFSQTEAAIVEREVSFTMYGEEEVSDVARTFIKVDLNRVPNAGQNADTLVCPRFVNFNPLDLLGENVDANGRWEPALNNNEKDLFRTNQNPSGRYQYITQTGECPADTATLRVNYIEIDTFVPERFPGVLCGKDDTLLLDVSISNGVDYYWRDRPSSAVYTVTEPSHYDYRIIDENGCKQQGFYLIHLIEDGQASQTSQLLELCEGEVYERAGISYNQDTMLCQTFARMNNCDSTHCVELRFGPSARVGVAASICEGETYSFFGQTLHQSGTFLGQAASVGLCDSVVELSLRVLPRKVTFIDTMLRKGESFLVGTEAYTDPGTYIVDLTSKEGCDSIVHLVLDVSTSTADVASALYQARLQPNPTLASTSNLVLSTKKKEQLQLKLFDVTGSLLVEQKQVVVPGQTTIALDLSSVSGIYWVQVLSESGQMQLLKGLRL